MKKLRLNLDSLRVDSFQTAPPVSGHGTVRPHESLEPEPDPVPVTYDCYPTGSGTCAGGTCAAGSCAYTCGGGCSNVATCGGYTCWQTCANTCDVCTPDEG